MAVVCCLFVLDDYDDATKRRTFRDLASVLRPGGRMLVAGYAPDDERMGPRRGEVSAAATDVHLEGESYYRQILESLGDRTTLSVEHVRTTRAPESMRRVERPVAAADAPSPMRRHFLIGSVRTVGT